MKKLLLAFSLLCVWQGLTAQSLTGTDANGNIQQYDEMGNPRSENNSFNPNRTDSTRKSKTVPKGLHVWKIDRKLGSITPTTVDTIPHLFPNTTLATGTYGTYNTTGSNYTPRQSRIFLERKDMMQFMFMHPYSQVMKTPDEIHFTNTLSPITNLTYDNCGDKQNGEDHIDAKFAVNAGKRIGIGFDIDYDYARGYFQNQGVSHFNATLFGSYIGDKYQMHVVYSQHHRKTTENGGITNDDYITHPELFSESFNDNEIPVNLSSNWNRNDSRHIFLSHRYNVGFYRDVKMTDEEIEARKFAEKSKKENDKKKKSEEKPKGRDKNAKVSDNPAGGRPKDAVIAGDEPGQAKPTANDSIAALDSIANTIDTTRINVANKAIEDSLLAIDAAKDSAMMYMKKEFVPVTSFIHTFDYDNYEHIYQAYRSPKGYYANTYYNNFAGNSYTGDSIYDVTKYMMLKNTLGIGLLEGFNKWAKAGINIFATHELRQFDMPQFDTTAKIGYMERWTEHNVSVGGSLAKTQGKTLHYNLQAETWVVGEDAGQLKVDFSTDLNFPLFGDTVRLAANGYLHRLNPIFFERRFHSKHFWWDNSLDMTHRLKAEGVFAFDKTNTTLRVAIEEIQNYTYFSMDYTYTPSTGVKSISACVKQDSEILNIITAQIDQKLSLGPIHWDNVITYQSTTNSNLLPLPTLNLFSNLYLKFVYAKVLSVELGGTATYFTSYEAPDYVPQLGQYAIHSNAANKVTLGDFPIIDVYANLHLKHARFFVMMTNITSSSFNRKSFLTPHYPLNRQVFKMGVSWNFFN